MATRSERFKAAAERSGPKRPPKSADKKGATKKLSARAKSIVSAEDPESARRYGGMSTAARNAGKPVTGRGKSGRGIYVLEDSRADKPPSRKSTRKSKAHVKSGTALTTRTQVRVSSPQARHSTRT